MKKNLRDIFEAHEGRLVRKWVHYFDAYERHFERFRGKNIVMLEIGVCDGGSLQLWREYFGDQARIIGVDLDPRCKAFEQDGIEIHIGSQDDRIFLQDLKVKIPKVDILLDDGGHTMLQQITTFEELFDHVKEDGVYMCEDMHTSYWPTYGGGHNVDGSFIEYCKGLVDQLNAWHSKETSFGVDEFTRSAVSMHFYDSITAIEKKKVTEPTVKGKGKWNYHPEDLKRVLDIYDKKFRDCDSAPIWMQLNYGDALYQSGRLAEARVVFEKCLSHNTDLWSTHLKLAQVALKANDFDSAITHSNNTLNLRPGLAPALLIMAEANVALEKPSLSRKYLEELLDSNPSHKGARRILESIN